MTSDEKIKWVRDQIYEQEKLLGLGMANFPLWPVEQEIGNSIDSMDFLSFFEIEKGTNDKTKRKVVVMTIDEQVNILKQFEKDNLIRIIDLKGHSATLEVFPPHPSPIKLKTLEHIAREISNIFSGSQIVDTLLGYGIPRADIPYPNTKWRTLQDMFVFLATSPSPAQREKFGGAITIFLHPLNFGADESASHKLIDDFNKYLKYDGYEITVADDGDGYKLGTTTEKTKVAPPIKPLTEEEERAERIARNTPRPSTRIPEPNIIDFKELPTEEQEQIYSDQVEYETGMLRQPKTAEQLAVIREVYKTLMAIVSSFCIDPTKPSRELNTAYVELTKTVIEKFNNFCGDTGEFETFSFDDYIENNFGVPFTNLYSAELEFKKKGRQMHWDEMRPEMNAVLGQIEELCQTANSPEVISEPKIQKVIGEAMLLLSEIAAKRKDTSATKSEKTIKMEITKMPEMQVRNVDENTITKGKKRIHLPKFKTTNWSKITMRFVDERNVLITADKKEQVLADYEILGFANEKSSRPNKAWDFLIGLAKNNGETKELPKPIPDNIRQKKLQLASRLKVIFKNESDPFHDSSETQTYKIKINLIAPEPNNEAPDKFGVKEYLKDMATEKE